MMLTVEYLTGLLSQIDSLTKELKDSESDNASLHRQLDHWQEISVHWKKERDELVDERNELAMQIDMQGGSIEAVQAANKRMAAELARPESTQVSLLRAERNALAADSARYRFITTHIVDEGDMDILERAFESMGESETCTQAEFDDCIDAAIVKEARQGCAMNNTKTPFEQWHYANGENTQGIPWVDKLVKAAWDAALEEAAAVADAGFKYAKDGYQIADDIGALK